MSRDIDRVIDYVRELERERFFPPVMAQVIVNRLDPPPAQHEIERARAEVGARNAAG
jgi:hypothetical protein